MKIHWLCHVPFEGLGNIEKWANDRGHTLSSTHFYEENYILPHIDKFDMLVVMGGPMSTYEEERYPFLIVEKRFITEAVNKGKKVLGICLGAQLIADVLGGKVYPNEYKEIGWFNVKKVNSDSQNPFSVFGEEESVFHWHGDTFTIPKQAEWILKSEACQNQGFTYNNGKVAALQFHIEMNKEGIAGICTNCANELTAGKYIMNAEEILGKVNLADANEKLLYKFMDRFSGI